MTETLTSVQLPTAVEKMVRVLDAKKARDIRLLHVAKQTLIADYFIICEGNTNSHLRALSDELEYQLSQDGIAPSHIEGHGDGNWILMDFSTVVVHIFNRETREYYHLEKLWEDADEIDVAPLLIKEIEQ